MSLGIACAARNLSRRTDSQANAGPSRAERDEHSRKPAHQPDGAWARQPVARSQARTARRARFGVSAARSRNPARARKSARAARRPARPSRRPLRPGSAGRPIGAVASRGLPHRRSNRRPAAEGSPRSVRLPLAAPVQHHSWLGPPPRRIAERAVACVRRGRIHWSRGPFFDELLYRASQSRRPATSPVRAPRRRPGLAGRRLPRAEAWRARHPRSSGSASVSCLRACRRQLASRAGKRLEC